MNPESRANLDIARCTWTPNTAFRFVDACACTSACACARACVRAGVTERSPAQPGPATAPGHPLPNLFRSCAQHQRTHGGQRHTTSFACKAVARRTWRRPPPRADPSPCRRPCASQPLSVKVGLCLDSLFSPLCLSVCLSVCLSLSLSLSLSVSLYPRAQLYGASPRSQVYGGAAGGRRSNGKARGRAHPLHPRASYGTPRHSRPGVPLARLLMNTRRRRPPRVA